MKTTDNNHRDWTRAELSRFMGNHGGRLSPLGFGNLADACAAWSDQRNGEAVKCLFSVLREMKADDNHTRHAVRALMSLILRIRMNPAAKPWPLLDDVIEAARIDRDWDGSDECLLCQGDLGSSKLWVRLHTSAALMPKSAEVSESEDQGLHQVCARCSLRAADALADHGYDAAAFIYNPDAT